MSEFDADRFDPYFYQAIHERVQHAIKKHPEGANYPALLDEIVEVRQAMKENDKEAYNYELLDVIAISIRLLKGV